MSQSSGSGSRIPLGVHARLAGTITVAGTVSALLIFVVAHPTEIIESTVVWFFLFPFTFAVASGVFTPKARRHLPDSYPVAGERQRLRNVGFTVGLLVVAYTVAVLVFVFAVIAGTILSTTDGDSPLIPALFVVLSALAIAPLPPLYVRWKLRKATADFAYEMKDRAIAVLLAAFVGGLGGHKFYTGQRWDGVVYLVFCWTFVPWLLGWYAAVKYLTMDADDFRRRVAAAYGEPIPDDAGEPATDGTGESFFDGADGFASGETNDGLRDENGEPVCDEIDGGTSGETSEPPEDAGSVKTGQTASFEEDDPSSEERTVDELERLYALYEEGAITEDEYERSKAELLDGS